MKNPFSFRMFVVVALVIVLCLGVTVYTGATGNSNPVATGLGVVIKPIQKGISQIGNMISKGSSYFEGYDALEKENEELKAQVRELEEKVREADLAISERDNLRTLLGLKENNPQFTHCEPAEVISRNPGEWATTVSLDKGSNDGVELNDVVITEDGMVGYVSSVAPTYCDVTTVVDTNMQAGAIVTRTREVGVAEGDYTLMNEGALKLAYLETDAEVVIGDTVETSGMGGVFPKGIMIGTVERVLPEGNGISNYAVIKPFVNVKEVKSVYIITDFEVNG